MNSKEAFQILGLSEDASAEEIKKKYRELTKKYHPDVCKEPDADKNFAKINDANKIAQSVRDGTYQDPDQFIGNPFSGSGFGFNINDLLNNLHGFKNNSHFKRSKIHDEPHVNINISFEESVKGCQKDISFMRQTKCNSCEGQGFIRKKNDCTKCDGFGRIVSKNKNMISSSTCTSCYGKNISKSNCSACHGEGAIDAESSFQIKIPPGILNEQTLRLGGAGHFFNSSFGEMSGDAFLHVFVEPHPKMKIDGIDVLSEIEISLLDALNGTSKKEETVFGEVDVKIPPKTKNADIVTFNKKGVGKRGDHKFKILVKYPEDISSLIEFLKDK